MINNTKQQKTFSHTNQTFLTLPTPKNTKRQNRRHHTITSPKTTPQQGKQRYLRYNSQRLES